MATGSQDSISGIELDDDRYKVVQSIWRNKYRAEDMAGNTVLRGKQKMLKLKEEFPFVDDQDAPVFTVKAEGILDVAGDYTMIDDRTEEPIVVLDREFTLLVDKWKIRDPETEEVLARIDSKSKFMELLRAISDLAKMFPHKYEITTDGGEHVGTIDGQFTLLKDVYEVQIDDERDTPREAIVAAAMVVDALEGN